MDRSSGSGVFARDPDALIDLIELDLTEALMKQEEGKATCSIYRKYMETHNFDYLDEHVSQDDLLSVSAMDAHAKKAIPHLMDSALAEINQAIRKVKIRSAWRVEGTLREYPKFDPVNMWFDYPIHTVDEVGSLKDIEPEGEAPPWKKNFTKKKTAAERKEEQKVALETAYEACSIDENVTVDSLAEYMGVTEKTIRNRIRNHGGFWVDDGHVGKK
jgi:RecA-family ATPase